MTFRLLLFKKYESHILLLIPVFVTTQLCNAYTELNDPVVQRQRFADQLKVIRYDTAAIC
jgi:lysyl-tRNA synthetase class II